MSLQLFMMALGGDRLALAGASLTHVISGGTATVGIRIDSDGQIYTRSAGGGFVAQYFWVTPSGNAANYECRWITGGSTPDTVPAASGTWVRCDTDRTWQEVSVASDTSYSFTLQIGRFGLSTPIKSVTITFNALGAP